MANIDARPQLRGENSEHPRNSVELATSAGQQYRFNHRKIAAILAVILLALAPAVVKRAAADDSIDSMRGQQQVEEQQEVEDRQDTEKSVGKSRFDLQKNLASFDKVWETIDQTHWDEEMVGAKWDEAKAKYRPQIEAAKSMQAARAAMNGLISELGQSHFAIIPADSYDVVGEGGGNATAGVAFRLTKDGVVVSKVRDGSPADQAGISPGWTVDRIRGKEVSEILEKIGKAAHGPMRVETLAGLTFRRMSSGDDGEAVEFVLRDPNGESKEVELKLVTPPGKVANFGNLPPIYITSDIRTLDGNVGYFGFSAFFEPQTIMPAFRKTVRDENHSNGIVIDLRGNIGGIGGMTMGMASLFSAESAKLGVMKMRGSEMKFAVNENYDPVTCPVAVLVDECSISSAEILSGGLQDLKLARVFGTRTAGLALPSTVIRLPNGDGFQYAFADYQSASGKTLEKEGVTPDVIVPLSREALLQDSDPALTRALEWIKQQNQKTNN